jgi:hypothetical protein
MARRPGKPLSRSVLKSGSVSIRPGGDNARELEAFEHAERREHSDEGLEKLDAYGVEAAPSRSEN